MNTATVIVGSSLGLAIGGKFSDRLQKVSIQSVGLFTLIVGLRMALSVSGIKESLIVLMSLTTGGIIGEILGIEDAMERLGRTLENRYSKNTRSGLFTQGFVTASLLFCVGPMAITGAIEDGMKGTYNILLTKSIMDGISSIVLSSSLGIGVVFSSIIVFIYQGALTLIATLIGKSLSIGAINCLTATGGLMVIGIGINLLGLGRIRVANLLPGLVIGGILGALL
ncbi:MAG: DUF554 domain-containing protein [bacterium]